MTSHSRLTHPTKVILPEPIVVSPLIRLARWGTLGLGILWGAYRYRQICKDYSDLREWEFEKKLAMAQEKATKKKWTDKVEMRSLMKEVGIPFEEGVIQIGVEHLYRDEKKN